MYGNQCFFKHSAFETEVYEDIYDETAEDSINFAETQQMEKSIASGESLCDALQSVSGSGKKIDMEARKAGRISYSVYWKYTKEVLSANGGILSAYVVGAQLLFNFTDLLMSQW